MELELEEHEASASADELAAELAASRTTRVSGFVRRRPETRTTFPEHLPKERVVVDPPSACECCGSVRLRKLGEDVTRTLESIPRCWKVVEMVREKFTCRDCERISQAPAPFHVIPRGWAGPSLLAMILYEKFGAHQPLNRLCERFALEGVPIPLSTAADAVGAACQVLQPVLSALERHVFSAACLHSDDTTVKVLAAGKTDTARCWVYVLDDGLLGARGRRRRWPTTRAIAEASIPSAIWLDGPACSRLTPSPAMAASTRRIASRADPGSRLLGLRASTTVKKSSQWRRRRIDRISRHCPSPREGLPGRRESRARPRRTQVDRMRPSCRPRPVSRRRAVPPPRPAPRADHRRTLRS